MVAIVDFVSSGEATSVNKATSRVFEVLAEFIGTNEPLGASELSRRLGMTRNMVHRALVTLSDEGLLFKDEVHGRYVLGFALAGLQNTAVATPSIRRIVRPYLERLSQVTGETVQLCLRSGDYQSVVDGVEGKGVVTLRVKLGQVTPLHASSGSRAILSMLSDDEVDDLIARRRPLKAFTSTTITDPRKLHAEVKRVRTERFARSIGDKNPSSYGVGFPFHDIDGRPFGAIVIGGPAERVSDAWLEQHLPQIEPIIDVLRKTTGLYEANQ